MVVPIHALQWYRFADTVTHGQFYGNQYVRTCQLKGLSHLGAFERMFTIGSDYANFQALYIADGNQFGINSQRYMASIVGRELGAFGGRLIGSSLGLLGMGVASVPLGTIGTIAGDCLGGEFGTAVGEGLFDLMR